MANDKYPHYNGIGDPRPWLRDMKLAMMVDFHGEERPDAAKVGFAILRMEDKAREWSKFKDFNSWDKFEEEVVERFGREEDEVQVVEELNKVRQTGDMTVRT